MRRKLQANAVQYSTLIVLWHAPTSPSYKAGTKAHLLQKQRQSRIDSESDGSARTFAVPNLSLPSERAQVLFFHKGSEEASSDSNYTRVTMEDR